MSIVINGINTIIVMVVIIEPKLECIASILKKMLSKNGTVLVVKACCSLA